MYPTLEVTIDLASVNTGDAGRDGHLKNTDFFETEKFPTATYRSTRVEKVAEEEYRIYGDLTLHGVTHEVPLHGYSRGSDEGYAGQSARRFHRAGGDKPKGLRPELECGAGDWRCAGQ